MNVRKIVMAAGATLLLGVGAAGAMVLNPGQAASVAAGLEAHSVRSAL